MGYPLCAPFPAGPASLLLAAVVAAFAAPAAASAADGQIIVKYASGADAQDRADARDDADVVRDEALAAAEHRARHARGRHERRRGRRRPRGAPPTSPTPSPTSPRSAFERYPDEARVDDDGTPLNDQPFANLWASRTTPARRSTAPPGARGADIGAPAAWDVTTGSKDVTVAVVDSGVDRSHPDLFANLVPGYDFAYDDADPTDYEATARTSRASSARAATTASGVTGVAWDASLMPVQALDADGARHTSSDIVAAYAYAADPRRADRQRVLRRLEPVAVRVRRDRGTPRTSSSSSPRATRRNNDIARRPTPARTTCRTSSASRRPTTTTSLASFSNDGRSSVDIAAPGVDIYSTYRCDSYGWMSGTSMAAPEVSGAAALVLAEHPTYTAAGCAGA